MLILGLNHGEFNSSAALVKNGMVIAGAPEERFTRIKKTKSFPKNAINFCLNYEKNLLSDCDYIAQGWNPGEYWQKFNPLLSSFRKRREDYFFTIPDNLFDFSNRNSSDWVLLNSSNDNLMPPIYFIKHHLTHAANAFFLSPFEEAAILTCDWKGEFETTTLGMGKENKIEIFKRQTMPHSLGMFYSTFTSLLGFQPNNDEWKVMALSAYDVDYNDHLKKIRKTISLTNDGLFELDQSYYQGDQLEKPTLYTQKLIDLLDADDRPEKITDWHLSIAKAMQQVSEEIVFHMLKHLHSKTKSNNLVLGGGYFMNSVCNGKIIKETPFNDVYISYSPADVGNSMGAALYVSHCIHGEKRNIGYNSSFIGPAYSDDDIINSLEKRKINYSTLDNTSQEIASILSQGNIIAFFNGRMEFGERALGHRSILADPRPEGMKDKINSIIKYRESFRPFAPAVLNESVSKYFDVLPDFSCNYMEKVVQVKNEYRKKLLAITHVDGSGRVQTVQKHDNHIFYNVIKEFEKITGFPIVLNTSFNINKESIALSPDDALQTFFNSGLEYLCMNKFLIKK